MADIFLSYAREDIEKAKLLAAALEQQGWCVFWDRKSIRPGKDIDDVIEEAISAAKCMVVLWSAAAKQSPWVKGEARDGLKRRIFLPVLLEDTALPHDLRSVLSVNLIDWHNDLQHEEYINLLGAVTDLAGTAPQNKLAGVATNSQPVTLKASKTPPPQVIILPEDADKLWTSDWGEDAYGLWNAFTYKGVRQLFRWIKPGSFMMGSLESEKGRFDDETQHQVSFSKGFWLAETTVTQALWQAVMGDNPSEFKGENRPVENVSWDDTQAFISKFNSLQPQLKLGLPSEAQWEYACRAGTSTPFNFGAEVSLAKVNYCGTWDKDEGEWKEGALRQTTDVKKYPPNAWGLYEMHGNVLEWCEDVWQADLGIKAAIDPLATSQQAGVNRVLRGGAWSFIAQYCRSACRYYDRPDIRSSDIGFRLALGQ